MTVNVKKNSTVKNRKYLKNFEKMCCLIETGTNTAERNKRSESRVSTPHSKNELPPESPICRTMTIGHSSHQETDISTSITQPFYNSDLYQRSNQASEASNIYRPETRSVDKNNNSSTRHLSNFTLSSVSDKMIKSIQNSDKMICTSSFVGLFSDNSLTKENDRSEKASYVSPSISKISSRSSFPTRMYHTSSRHWAFGMVLVMLIILSAFSTSSTVMCVPLGHQSGVGDETSSSSLTDSNRRSGGAVIMSNARLLELEKKAHSLGDTASILNLHDKGQIYLPSLLKNEQVKAAAAALASPVDYPFRGAGAGRNAGFGLEEDQQNNSHHPLTSYTIERWQTAATENKPATQNRMPIQKLPALDLGLTRSKEEEKDDDDFDDDNASGISQSESELGLINEDASDTNDDDENVNSGQPEWETVIDPHLYVLAEWNTEPYQEQFPLLQQQRKRRNSGTGPSLSIVNPLDVLRQRLLLEIARRRMRQSHNQIIANEEILRKIGRRR